MPRFLAPTPFLFALTLFVSAVLLFQLQPMAGKAILPVLGGAPAVWNTCMVFFQAVLLAGYLYVHATTTWLGMRARTLLHTGLVLSACLFLPVTLDQDWLRAGEGNPVPRLLGLLLMSVGLPLFAVSTSAPLLQKWFASTNHPAATDPYFLYGASNLGSLLGLLGYPVLIESHLQLASQRWLWTAGYLALAALTLGCTAITWRLAPGARETRLDASSSCRAQPVLTLRRRCRWVMLAFIPSSLMLGATTYLTTDVAAVPLLWVIPLALYLLSFTLVFATTARALHRAMTRALPLLILLLVFLMTAGARPPFWQFWMTILLHLAGLFVAAMVCHGELAGDRPPPRHLTEFYLWISVGGVLGGLFNGLAAPLLFATPVEYSLALVLACLFLPRSDPDGNKRRSRRLDIVVPVGLLMLTVGLHAGSLLANPRADWLRGAWKSVFPLESDGLNRALRLALPLALCYLSVKRPLRFGLSVGAVLLAGAWCADRASDVLHRERGFFGVLTVERFGNYHRLGHGTTVHGMQSLDPARRREPLTYYHRAGPMGQVFAALSGPRGRRDIACVGLGTGTLVCYGESGQRWTFYEIDPAVADLAWNPRYFTYLRDGVARGVDLQVIPGDARLRLEKAADRRYDLLVIDAFTSGAIPVHLLTREALDLYLARLAEGGVLVVHISNRHVDLEPVLGNLASAASLVGLVQSDRTRQPGKTASHWVVLARRREDFGSLANDPRWRPLSGRPNVGVWTDDYSNLFSAFRWGD